MPKCTQGQCNLLSSFVTITRDPQLPNLFSKLLPVCWKGKSTLVSCGAKGWRRRRRVGKGCCSTLALWQRPPAQRHHAMFPQDPVQVICHILSVRSHLSSEASVYETWAKGVDLWSAQHLQLPQVSRRGWGSCRRVPHAAHHKPQSFSKGHLRHWHRTDWVGFYSLFLPNSHLRSHKVPANTTGHYREVRCYWELGFGLPAPTGCRNKDATEPSSLLLTVTSPNGAFTERVIFSPNVG